MKVLDDIITALDCEQSCIATFIDLAKAEVDHMILLQRLSSISLSSTCYDWFVSYLTNRVQQVKVENILADPLTISKGVPQGSILGPTLFFPFTLMMWQKLQAALKSIYMPMTLSYINLAHLHSAASTLQLSLTSDEHSFHDQMYHL